MTTAQVQSTECVSREEALSLLGVKAETLYSYVSRGLIRRIATTDGRSFYARDDVERVRARSIARSGHGPVAAAAVHWGEPILTTHLTQVTAGGPAYRGLLATDLARQGRKFEAIARYLWSGSWNEPQDSFEVPAELPKALERAYAAQSGLHIRHMMAHAVLGLAYRPPAADESIEVTGCRLLGAVVGTLGFVGPSKAFVRPRARESISATALRALGAPADKKSAAALDAVLILCADHDLTPATFAGRIAASIGADLYACIGAALNAHFGAHFGLGFDRLEMELAEGVSQELRAVRGAGTPARYHHPLYPKGDPRARFIVDVVGGLQAPAPQRVETAVARLTGSPGRASKKPTIEEALAAFSYALDLPAQSAGPLFTLGRFAGWLAHAREQQQSGFVIRPRARFLADHTRTPDPP